MTDVYSALVRRKCKKGTEAMLNFDECDDQRGTVSE